MTQKVPYSSMKGPNGVKDVFPEGHMVQCGSHMSPLNDLDVRSFVGFGLNIEDNESIMQSKERSCDGKIHIPVPLLEIQ